MMMAEVESAGLSSGMLKAIAAEPPLRCASRIRADIEHGHAEAAEESIRVRDTAIREAAKLEGKREALLELKRLVETSRWLDLANRKESGWGRAYQSAMKDLIAKYTPATETPPAQDGEGR